MNVFRVTVSEQCRKSNRRLVDFVVKTESDYNEVYSYYSKNYTGLLVSVCECVALDLLMPKKEEPNKVELNQVTKKVLTINEVKLIDSELKILETCKRYKKDYESISASLYYAIRDRLSKSFSLVLTEYNSGVEVEIEKDWNVKAKISIAGSINEIVELLEPNQVNNEAKEG